MKGKVLTFVLTLTMVVTLLVGCTGKSDSAASSTGESKGETQTDTSKSSADESKPVTLRFSWWGGDERNNATLEVIKQFEKEHPNVTIEAEYGGNDGYHDKLATQLAAGTAPDIVQVDPETFPTYVESGDYFINYAEYQMDLSNFDESYISLPINGRYDGKQLGLPSGISGAGLLVNKDLADKVGIDFTKDYTWDDLLEMGKKVKQYDPNMYLLCMNKEYLTNLVVYNYAKQLAGKSIFDAGTKKLNLTEEQLKQVFEYVKKLYDEGVVAPASYQAAYSGDNLQSDVNWVNGKYVATFTYVSTMDVMVAANKNANYYAGKLPIMTGATEAGWASNTPQIFAITKTSKNAEVAVEFMNYFFNDDTAIETLGCTRSVPPTAKAREICTEKGLLSKTTMDSANIASTMGGTPNDKISSSEEAKAIFFDAVESIGYASTAPDAAASDVMSLLSNLGE